MTTTERQSTRDILVRARARLERDGVMVRGMLWRNADGSRASVPHDDVAACCSIGAIDVEAQWLGKKGEEWRLAIVACDRAETALKAAVGSESLGVWHDAQPGLDSVLAGFDKAIASLGD